MCKSLLRYWCLLNTFGVINILAPVANKKKIMSALCEGSVRLALPRHTYTHSNMPVCPIPDKTRRIWITASYIKLFYTVRV